MGNDIQRGPSCAFEESRHVVLASAEEYLGPQCAVSKVRFAPITAHKACIETVLLGIEVGGNERKDLGRDMIDGDE